MRRSLDRDQGEEIGRQVSPFATASKRGRYRSTRDLRPGRLSGADVVPSNPINAPAGDFLTLASSGILFERQMEAITQLLSGELRAGAVKARRPRADHARGRSEATSLARRRAQIKLCCVMAGGLPVERGSVARRRTMERSASRTT